MIHTVRNELISKRGIARHQVTSARILSPQRLEKARCDILLFGTTCKQHNKSSYLTKNPPQAIGITTSEWGGTSKILSTTYIYISDTCTHHIIDAYLLAGLLPEHVIGRQRLGEFDKLYTTGGAGVGGLGPFVDTMEAVHVALKEHGKRRKQGRKTKGKQKNTSHVEKTTCIQKNGGIWLQRKNISKKNDVYT